MSAVIQQQRVRLELPAQRPMLRQLIIELRGHYELQVAVKPPGDAHIASVFSFGALPRCRLDLERPTIGLSLWVSGTAFEVTPAEAEAIAAHFEPHGLRVLR